MARVQKTVFISYRRTDVYTALAVYENLKNQGYDVFFDYRSISSGDFEQIINSNIRARAHFLLILTPTALDRCNEPGDWLRREIELAIDEKRNIVPLFFKEFRFGAASVAQKLTGKLKNLSRYNGLNVHEDYFDEAMHRLRTQYLNIPLETVLHPVSTEVQKVVREEQVAADKALEQIEDVKELVKQVEPKTGLEESERVPTLSHVPREVGKKTAISSRFNIRSVGGVVGGFLIIGFLVWGGTKLFQNLAVATSEPTPTFPASATVTSQPSETNVSSPTQTTISPTSELGIGSTMISEKDGMTLLYVPAGEFTMGSNNGYSNEKPAHKVHLDAFWIDETEVTNRMYNLCINAGECVMLNTDLLTNEGYANHPVTWVLWTNANTYCSWAGRRLPTEAEWEKAARGTDGREYPWGNNKPDSGLLNYDNEIGETTEVGNYPYGISPYGALDMAGNVWEWVSSLSKPYPYDATDGREDLSSTGDRILRGGSWSNFQVGPAEVRSAVRFPSPPGTTYSDYGFRCAMDATP